MSPLMATGSRRVGVAVALLLSVLVLGPAPHRPSCFAERGDQPGLRRRRQRRVDLSQRLHRTLQPKRRPGEPGRMVGAVRVGDRNGTGVTTVTALPARSRPAATSWSSRRWARGSHATHPATSSRHADRDERHRRQGRAGEHPCARGQAATLPVRRLPGSSTSSATARPPTSSKAARPADATRPPASATTTDATRPTTTRPTSRRARDAAEHLQPANACGGPTEPDRRRRGQPVLASPRGGNTLLTVAVTPGETPTSTGLAVTADLDGDRRRGRRSRSSTTGPTAT